MTTRGDQVHELIDAVQALRAAVAEVSLPLPLPSAEPARADRTALLAQLDDYVLPRLTSPHAPLLVAVSGSTGAGKSTLVNSLVRAPVSPAGVLRPTTRTPVLVCHPADTAWFRSGAPLGSLASPLPPIVAPALLAGLALLDVPEVRAGPRNTAGVGAGPRDTAGNDALGGQLRAAADLWLFVTTAARYADAVPWSHLHSARERGAVVALVLDRVPPDGPHQVEVVSHLTELLTAHGLAGLPLFVLPEARVDGQGLLPEWAMVRLRGWLDGLARDPRARAAVAQCTLDGVLATLPPRIDALVIAAAEQVTTAEELAEKVGMAYGTARGTLERGVRDGALRPADAATLVCAVAADAAEQAYLAWRAHPAGQAMLAPAPAGPPAHLAAKVDRLARAAPAQGVRGDLLERVGELLDAEAARWLDGLAGVPPDNGPARRLYDAGAAVERARVSLRPAPATADPATAGTSAASAAGFADPVAAGADERWAGR